jgi:hypothetical protein
MLSPSAPPSPTALLNHDFIPMRARLIELAAFLDRIDRFGGTDDFRLTAFRAAAKELASDQPDRARRILELFSDHTLGPIEKATTKGAVGAVPLTTPAGH